MVSVARHYLGLGLSLLDLVQEGNLGLQIGVDKYDWQRGFRLSTYARVTDMRSGERLPTFSVRLDPPPVGISATAVTALARLSAEQYGRDALDVELDLQSAMARVRGPQKISDTTEQGNSPPSLH